MQSQGISLRHFQISQTQSHGFTMVELILVILLFGILSAIAIPKFTAKTDFDARGFYDQTQSMLRFAHKTAIAQRRPVWVQISQAAGIMCLTYVQVNVNCQSDGGAPVYASGESNWYVQTAPTDLRFGSSPNFSFDALGRISTGTTINLSIFQNSSTLVGTIIIEAETGYVH
ncbi:GspH/FimT family pseudopilin [Undibacterium fentianense]|uniref:Type II secretion system protein H n=1 Tax=Undibacterium fentianense TaxID=2828728 RepID=A0A941ICD2_9BURK|nr:GspH/FimT family pseudopilin [Undibacterium fentianense]MBR7800059.1 GspH/FimT family pseudopilin [Undibacterium fentianense]